MYLYHIYKIFSSFSFSFSLWLMRFSLKQTQLCLDDNVDKKKNWFSNRKNFSLRVLLNFYLIFFRCQLGVAYKSFAYKINVYRKTGTKLITKFKMFQLSVEIQWMLGLKWAYTRRLHDALPTAVVFRESYVQSVHVTYTRGVYFYLFVCFLLSVFWNFGGRNIEDE